MESVYLNAEKVGQLLKGKNIILQMNTLPCIGDVFLAKEHFWTNGSEPSDSEFIVYHYEHYFGNRDVSMDRNGKMESAWFIGDFVLYEAKNMPDLFCRFFLEVQGVKKLKREGKYYYKVEFKLVKRSEVISGVYSEMD